MVFKAISNVSSAILQPLWTSADTLNEDNTEVLSPSSFPREHYKNRFIQNWQTADPKEVGVLPLEYARIYRVRTFPPFFPSSVLRPTQFLNDPSSLSLVKNKGGRGGVSGPLPWTRR